MGQLKYPPRTTLNGTINSSVTTVTLTSAPQFDGGSYLVIGTEIIDISGATFTGNVLTNCVRGALGTTAASHTTGANVYGLFSSDYPVDLFAEPSFWVNLAVQLGILQSGFSASVRPNTVSVVTGSRAIGTVYQNTGTTPMFVSISVTPDAAAHNLNALTDAANPPTVNVGSIAGDGTSTNRAQLQFWVLPGDHYEANLSAGTYTVNNWTEWN